MQEKNSSKPGSTRKIINRKYEELTFADDFMFCKILQNNSDLCCELLSMIIGRRVTGIHRSEIQKTVKITPYAKGVRFDVYLDDDQNTVYDIEMQTTKEKNLPKRSRYYQGMMDLELIEQGAVYAELKKSYIIFICQQNPYPEEGLHKYTFKHICVEHPELEMGDETAKIILSVKGDADDISEEMKAFLQYVGGEQPASAFTRKLNEQVIRAREHKEWRGEYMTLLEKFEEYREEGREEGIYGTVEILRDIGISDTEIISKLMNQYGLDRETAENYLRED